MRRLAPVTSQAEFVGRGGRELCGIADVLSRRGFGVLLSRAVAGFAGLALPAALLVRFHRVMRVLRECVCQILMAGSASFGTRIPGEAAVGEPSGPRRPPRRSSEAPPPMRGSVLRMHLADREAAPSYGTRRNSLPAVGIRERVRSGRRICTWQPVQAEEMAGIGLIGPCGSVTAFLPSGRFCSLPLTWHMEQLRRSPGVPLRAHRRKAHFGEIVMRTAETHHNIRPIVR